MAVVARGGKIQMIGRHPKALPFLFALAMILIGLAAVLAFSASPTQLEDLKPWYNGYNETWFSNSLPHDTVVRWGLPDNGNIAETVKLPSGQFVISFSEKHASTSVISHLILLHEQCHIKTWDEFDRHGKQWKACMNSLYDRGAFKNGLIYDFDGTGTPRGPVVINK
jgi:hypothetical protein